MSRRIAPLALVMALFSLVVWAAGAAAIEFKESCPNDQLRKENPSFPPPEYSSANLPDCRAYEQVSPVNKNAGDVTGTVPYVRASLSGDRFIFASVSGVPGGVGSQEVPIYLASRSGGTWATDGLLPPASTGQNAAVLGWTPDLSWVFDQATKLGEPNKTTLLARPSSGAVLKSIADYTTELQPDLAGTSEGAREVLFESEKALLPGAVEGKSNVYLWQRQSNQLILAGILNDGGAPSEGAFAGSYDWIAGTSEATLSHGGANRGYYTRDQNVISADGKAVFFTGAGTGQIYLRRNPTAAQSPLDGKGKCTDPELACTINISASRKTNGIGKGQTDVAGTQPAAFLGATPDGSIAYFTSSEKLTNDANTGPEANHPPAIAQAPLDEGSPVDLDFFSTKATEVAADETHVYWIDPDSKAIARAEIDGSNPEPEFIKAPAADNPQGLALDDEHIYWTNAEADEKDGEGSIGRAKLGIGEAEEVNGDFIPGEVEVSPGAFDVQIGKPRGIDVDENFVYWANKGLNSSSGVQAGYVGRAGINGGSVEPKFIAFGNGDVAVNSNHIYHSFGVSVLRTEIDGNFESTKDCVFSPDSRTPSVTLDSSHLYWSRKSASAIGRIKLSCEDPEPEFIKDAGNPEGLTANATHLYWPASQSLFPNPGNDVYRYEADSDTLVDLIPNLVDENGIEIQGVLGISEDGSHVYLVANGVPTGVVNSPNEQGESATLGNCKGTIGSASGSCNLYLWRKGVPALTFIAQLEVGGASFTDAANWVSTAFVESFPGEDFQKTARITPDGETLAFRSRRKLTDFDNNGIPQLYRFRAGTSGPTCITCNPSGTLPASGFGLINFFGSIKPPTVTPRPPASVLSHNLSEDGNRVFFQTIEPLVPEDVNGEKGCPPFGAFNQKFPACLDVYEWEAQGTGSCKSGLAGGGCLYLISTGKGNEPALIGDASASGNNVFFFIRTRLVGQDNDGLLDVYTAKVDGGLQAQNEPPKLLCDGEVACRPGVTPPPPAQPTNTETSLPGNPQSKPHCSKGKYRVKGHCVKKQSKGGKTKRRRASADRRTGR